MIELLLQAERAMSVGLVDRADVLYTQIAEADPQNSIAVVGLARVALERGDEPGALELARRALTIDPENAAASRMVDRLEEVLRYRDGGLPVRPEVAPPESAPPSPAPPSPAPPASPSPSPASPSPSPIQAPVALHAPEPPPTATPATIVAKSRLRSLLDRLLRRGQP